MQLSTPVPDHIVDLSGKRCPHLVIAIIAALRKMNDGQILQVTATDPVAPSSIAAWARQSGQTL
ncbi:MAG TPA: sulfurtransferase TusA family protein [Candidatus Binatia bacterium]|nr:sulfurtransferase TusA family protein [Candidatus Binatia bacterium]